MKFPGIDLSPGALIMRQRADKMREHLATQESILQKAIACGAGTPAERQCAGQLVEEAKREIARIEKEITS